MPNLRIVAKNIIDSATLSASPSLLTTLPETNLQRTERGKTARSTSTASQDWKASWSSAQRVNTVVLWRQNFTSAAQQRTRTYTDAAFSTGTVDNAAANCFAPTGLSRLDSFTDTDFRHLKTSVRYITQENSMQSMNVTTTDASNPDGYQEMSRIFAGEYFEFAYNPPHGGLLMTQADASEQGRMDDGSLVSDKRWKARRLELSPDFMTTADWVELLAIARYAGQDKDVFVDCYPTDDTYLGLYHRGLFKFAAPTTFDRHFYNLARAKLVLEEI